MIRKKSLFISLVAMFFLGCPLLVEAVDEHVWLHVEGQYIRKSPLCKDPGGIWMGCGADDRDYANTQSMPVRQNKVQWMADQKVNVARISISDLHDWSSAQSCVSNLLAQLVAWYKEKKIYVIIDSHYYMHDAPQSSSNILRNSPTWDVDDPDGSLVGRWLDDWVYFAGYFKDEPWVLGYELCNEPLFFDSQGNWSTDPADFALCRKNYMECIRRIRQVDTKHIILVGSHYYSHVECIRQCWEDGLADEEKYNPDPDYRQVVFTFHEYPNAHEIYSPAGTVNAEVARIQSIYKVPLMCTEFGYSGGMGGTDSVRRRFEQEMIEMCYGEPNFWQGALISNPAFPSRGTPAGYRISWTIFAVAGQGSAEWESNSKAIDIWRYAAPLQASSAPEPKSDSTPPSVISRVRDGLIAGVDVNTTDSTTQLSANWDSSADSESGVSGYYFAIGTTPGATNVTNGWLSNGTALAVTKTGLTLTPGQIYYFTVKAENGAGMQGNPANSDGQTVIGGGNKTVPGAYPNPFSLSRPGGMTFVVSGQAQGKLKIYTLNRKLVRTKTGTGTISWDGKNEGGEKIARGIYIYIITDETGSKTGKITVTK